MMCFCEKYRSIQREGNKNPFTPFYQEKRQQNENPKAYMKNKINTFGNAAKIACNDIEVWVNLIKLS